MKILVISTVMAMSLLVPLACALEPCQVGLYSEVEVAPGEVTLADLLSDVSCPSLAESARAIRLGAAPLEGSPRIIDGDMLRPLLERAARDAEVNANCRIPERVSIRRARSSASARKGEPAVFSRPPIGASSGPRLIAARATALALSTPQAAREIPLLHRGQTTNLLWDSGGIRLVVSAICLDPGSAGDTVRVRVAKSGAVLRAVVTSEGTVKAAL